MKLAASLLMTVLAVANTAAQSGSSMTKEQVLAKMDDNAKKFKSLDAAVERREWDGLSEVASTDSGKIYIQATNSSPRIKLDITQPQKRATVALIENGKYQLYEKTLNTVRGGEVKNADWLQMLSFGFGVTSDKILKSFNVESPAQETLNGETVTVMDFKAKEANPQIVGIRVWLSQKDWTPVKTELTQRGKDTWTFTYKDKKLNASVSNNVFKLDIPSSAKRY